MNYKMKGWSLIRSRPNYTDIIFFQYKFKTCSTALNSLIQRVQVQGVRNVRKISKVHPLLKLRIRSALPPRASQPIYWGD
jgi:hypothetical protein